MLPQLLSVSLPKVWHLTEEGRPTRIITQSYSGKCSSSNISFLSSQQVKTSALTSASGKLGVICNAVRIMVLKTNLIFKNRIWGHSLPHKLLSDLQVSG